ncbi:MAG: DUF1476 domain-containing protein [Pikeienuella sp.]
MSSLDEREKAFENKYAHDAELKFKVDARRNKLLGMWLAPQIGQSNAEAYAKTVVMSDLEEEGVEDVVRKVMGDIATANANVSEDDIREKLTELGTVAKEQIMSEV